MKKYLDDLKTALNETKRFSEAEIKDILADHEEMINEAIRSGLAEAEIETKFGNPRKVAADLSDSCGAARTGATPKTDAVFSGTPPAGTVDIAFHLASDDVSLTAEARDDFAVYCTGKAPLDRYDIGFNGNEFVIRMKKGDFGGWFHRGALAFDVRVPAKTELGTIQFQQASGDYCVCGVKAGKLRINTASGDGTIGDGSFDRIEIASVNGDLRLDKIITGEVSVTQVSGDLSVSHLVCEGDLTVVSTSGDVSIIDSTCVAAAFHTVSGDLEGKEFYPESIEMHGVSGDVDIDNVDKTRPIRVKSTKSISGSIRIR